LETDRPPVGCAGKRNETPAERLIANPAETIADMSGQPIPASLIVSAARNADGAVEISAKADPKSDVELDEEALETVSGGASAIEYGLIAPGISIAIIGAVGALGASLNTKFKAIGNSIGTTSTSSGG
jgi:pilus assembly protein Flp/PilA